MGCLDGNWRVPGEWPETRRGLGPCFVSIVAGEGWAPVSLASPPVLEAVLVDVEIGALGVLLGLVVTL